MLVGRVAPNVAIDDSTCPRTTSTVVRATARKALGSRLLSLVPPGNQQCCQSPPGASRVAGVPPASLRVPMMFALFAIFGVLAMFVLHGAAAAAAALAAMLTFIFACMAALSRQDAATRRDSDRVGLAGWFGGWF
jgi:hypothetical protein